MTEGLKSEALFLKSIFEKSLRLALEPPLTGSMRRVTGLNERRDFFEIAFEKSSGLP